MRWRVRAVGFTEFGGPEVMRILQLPEPHAGPGQVRIKVVASDVNPSDVNARLGGGDRCGRRLRGGTGQG